MERVELNRPGFKFPLTSMNCLALGKLFTLTDLFSLFDTYQLRPKEYNV